MRSLAIQVPRSRGHAILSLAREHGASGERLSHGSDPHGRELALIELEISNQRLGGLIMAAADAEPGARFTFAPSGTLTVEPPISEIRDRVRDVSPRSSLELVLGALQSIGSWRGLLLYALLSGVVAAYAVIFNIPYLLTAAMLISPMGGPAMVAVIALVIGDMKMMRRGGLRFWISILVLALSAAAAGWAYGLDFSTETMELISSLSNWAILIALAGGAAGALAQVQSERDSLVTATATGFLVAVSLSPPAAVLGLGVVIGRWDYVAQMSVLLLLTFLGILIGGSATLLVYGIGRGSAADSRGSRRARLLAGALVVLGAASLVLWQSGQAPEFRKADLSRDAVRLTREAVSASAGFRLLQANAAFTRPDRPAVDGEALLIQVWVAVDPGTGHAERQRAEGALRSRIVERVQTTLPGVSPFVEITALELPAGP